MYLTESGDVIWDHQTGPIEFVKAAAGQYIQFVTHSPAAHAAVTVHTGDVIFGSPPQISLLKMDTQGYECNILDGMRRLLPHIFAIKVELEGSLLDYQGCSADGMMTRVETAGLLKKYCGEQFNVLVHHDMRETNTQLIIFITTVTNLITKIFFVLNLN